MNIIVPNCISSRAVPGVYATGGRSKDRREVSMDRETPREREMIFLSGASGEIDPSFDHVKVETPADASKSIWRFDASLHLEIS